MQGTTTLAGSSRSRYSPPRFANMLSRCRNQFPGRSIAFARYSTTAPPAPTTAQSPLASTSTAPSAASSYPAAPRQQQRYRRDTPIQRDLPKVTASPCRSPRPRTSKLTAFTLASLSVFNAHPPRCSLVRDSVMGRLPLLRYQQRTSKFVRRALPSFPTPLLPRRSRLPRRQRQDATPRR